MAWEKCDKCWYYFDTETARDNGKVFYNGYEIGTACDCCKDKIFNNNESFQKG